MERYEQTGPFYTFFDQLFSTYPYLQFVSVGIVGCMLVGILFLKQLYLKKFPPYVYMSWILCAVALLDVLTQVIPLVAIYVIVLNYALFRSEKENTTLIMMVYTGAFVFIKSMTLWHHWILFELLDESLLFLWTGWMSIQMKHSFTEMKRMRDQNRYLAEKMREVRRQADELGGRIAQTYQRDELTGTYNMIGFQERVLQEVKTRRRYQCYYVICIDLIHFQQVSQQQGVDVGRRVLRQLAYHLKKRLPPSTLIARYNGNQFAVGILGNRMTLNRCLSVIEKVIGSMNQEQFTLQYCVGMASYPQDTRSATEVVRLAERRLLAQQRRLHYREEEKKGQLEKLSALGQLAAGLAHEIRNPLTSIRGFVQISSGESPEVKKWESVILPEIDRINDLLKQFLKLSESRPAKWSKFNLDECIHDVFCLLGPKFFLMGHELSIQAVDTGIEIEADREQLKQVLINLIYNALESLEEKKEATGDIKGKVEIFWEQVHDQVVIRVRDTGNGIEEKYQAKIFDPFFTTKGDGTGMGLAVCQRIILDHGGRIQVSTQVGEGTEFRLFLRILQSEKSQQG